MTAPTLIRQLIEDGRDAVTLSNGKTSEPFPLIVGGWFKDAQGKEGKLKSIDPISIIAKDDTQLTGELTPLYPYFNNGSVLKSVTQINKISTKRHPLLILDTLDRGETAVGQYSSYDTRAFITMLAKDGDNADQFREVYEKGLKELADWCVIVLKERIFTNEGKLYRERWGDAEQYGRSEDNVFKKLTDAVEITGDFIFNPKQKCNDK